MCGSLFEELLRTSGSRNEMGSAGEKTVIWVDEGSVDDGPPIEPALLQRFGRACLMAATAAQLTRRIAGVDAVERRIAAPKRNE